MKTKEEIKIQTDLNYLKNREVLLTKSKIDRQQNPNKYQAKSKKYREKYKKELSIKRKERYLKNKIQEKEYYLKNREKILKRQRKYYKKFYKKNKEILQKKHKAYREIADYDKKYFKNNKVKIYKRKKKQRDLNPILRVQISLRGRLHHALNRNSKSSTTMGLVGCSIDFLKQLLESQFKSRMSWDNYGRGFNGKGMQEWHIDHIKPCASFDLSKPEEQLKCFHYTNLQPLWATENLIKSDRIL